MPSVSVHAHTLQELGLDALRQAITSNKWPVQVTLFTRFRQYVQSFAIFTTLHATHRFPLNPVPFHPHTHRAVFSLTPDTYNYTIIRAHSVVASGTLTVLPLKYPSSPIEPTPSNSHAPFASPLNDGVTFTFAQLIPRMSAVQLEIHASSSRSTPMIRRGQRFTRKLALSPGVHRYRFRLLFQPPLRRVTDVPLARVGWNFANSFRWGVATQWMTVIVPSQYFPSHHSSQIDTAHRQHILHGNSLSNPVTHVHQNQLETVQSIVSSDESSSETSEVSDTLIRIDAALDGYSSEVSTSEVSDDIDQLGTSSSTSEMSATASSSPRARAVSIDLLLLHAYRRVYHTDASPSTESPSTDSSSIETGNFESISSPSSLTSTSSVLLVDTTFTRIESQRNTEESLIEALQVTPNVRNEIWVTDASLHANLTQQRERYSSQKGSDDTKKSATSVVESGFTWGDDGCCRQHGVAC